MAPADGTETTGTSINPLAVPPSAYLSASAFESVRRTVAETSRYARLSQNIAAQSIAASVAALEYESIRSTVATVMEAQRTLAHTSIIPAMEAAANLQRDAGSTILTATRLYDSMSSTLGSIVLAQDAARLSVARIAVDYASTITAAAGLASQQRAILTASLEPAMKAYAQYQSAAASIALQTRFRTLEQGFRGASGTPADTFGTVLNAVDRHPALRASLDGAIRSTQMRGSFGADLVGLRSGAADIADAFDEAGDDPSLMAPLEALQETTHLSDEVLFNTGDVLGLWGRVVTNQSPTARLLFSYTIGISGYVALTAGGASFPEAFFTSVAGGGNIYLTLRGNARN